MATLFDAVMDYGRVQQFMRLYPKRNSTVAGDFLGVINGFRRKSKLTPEIVVSILSEQDYDHERIIEQHKGEALYVAEYYIVWAAMTKKDRKEIQAARTEAYLERQ